MATKWGIASAGLISHDFTNAIGLHPSSDHKVVAVAARKLEDAKEFATKHGIEKAYSDYEDLARDADIDVIYIGSINTVHLAMAKMYLNAGKAVLCEKPLCMNVKETQELVALARSKKVFLMEAVWSRCLPAYKALREEIAAGTIGDVKQVIATFGEVIDVPRMHKKDLGGGTILDLGIYAIQVAQMVFGGETPTVVASGHMGDDGVDESTSTTLTYKNGKTATLVTHSKVKLPNEALVVGTKGTLTLPYPMWTPTELRTPTGSKHFPVPTGAKHSFNFNNSANMSFESQHVRECLLAGKTESHLVSLDETLTMASIMEQVRKQIGVVYNQD